MTMTSKKMIPQERVSRCIRGIKPDKLPIVVINSNTFMCLYYGVSVEDYVSKPEVCADVNIKFIKEFEVDCDIVATGYILYGAGPELGVKWEFAGNNFPGFVDVPIQSEADLDKIKVPSEPSGYFKNYVEAIKIINQAVGDTYHLKASFLGPFSLVCFLRGIEETLIDMIMNPDFFKECIKLCSEISVFLGKNLLSTGLRYPILNEIFLSPGMMNPDTYHSLVAPYDLEVQRRLGPGIAPNSFAFMGIPNDQESKKADMSLFKAFFGVGESIEAIKEATRYRAAGFPFPAAISGRALNSWDTKMILSFLNAALDYLINKEGIYPSISLSSVQADTVDKASDIAEKIKAVNAFRDEYAL
jgi:uroporphyrinogen-III decarboxylase